MSEETVHGSIVEDRLAESRDYLLSSRGDIVLLLTRTRSPSAFSIRSSLQIGCTESPGADSAGGISLISHSSETFRYLDS